ncbi:hypothetical protein BH10PSE19_BH10PSE19_08200 [soil metagenome]
MYGCMSSVGGAKLSVEVRKDVKDLQAQVNLWRTSSWFGSSLSCQIKDYDYKLILKQLETALKDPEVTDEVMRQIIAEIRNTHLSFLYPPVSIPAPTHRGNRSASLFSTPTSSVNFSTTFSPSRSSTAPPTEYKSSSAPSTPMLPPQRLDTRTTKSSSSASLPIVVPLPSLSLS